MIELRWKTIPDDEIPPTHAIPIGSRNTNIYRVLQYKALFSPIMIASGDIVLRLDHDSEWVDVPIELNHKGEKK